MVELSPKLINNYIKHKQTEDSNKKAETARQDIKARPTSMLMKAGTR